MVKLVFYLSFHFLYYLTEVFVKHQNCCQFFGNFNTLDEKIINFTKFWNFNREKLNKQHILKKICHIIDLYFFKLTIA